MIETSHSMNKTVLNSLKKFVDLVIEQEKSIFTRGGFLTCITLLFLFSGFYKESIPSAVDLTILSAILTYLAILPRLKESAKLLQSPIIMLMIVLTIWLALRLFPSVPAWGVRKLQEIVFFGPAAIAAGYLIAKDRKALDTLLLGLSYAAIPMALYVAVSAAIDNPYTFHWIGSSGYQGTGLVFSLSAIASTVSKRPICFGFSVLGCGVTGHLSGTFFGALAVSILWFLERNWRTIGKSVLISLMLLAIYTVTVAPPLTFMRFIWKSGAMLIVTATDNTVSPSKSENYLMKRGFSGRTIVKSLKAMPLESQKYLVDATAADRFEQYRFAIDQFIISPMVGQGYGAINYLGNKNPHNIVLEMLAESGIIGGALVIAIFCSTAFCYWKIKINESALFSLACFVLLICTAMVSGYWGGRILLFGIGLSIGANEKK